MLFCVVLATAVGLPDIRLVTVGARDFVVACGAWEFLFYCPEHVTDFSVCVECSAYVVFPA